MRDSALKRVVRGRQLLAQNGVGEELMRDSALKPDRREGVFNPATRRRRAHARQRFETIGRHWSVEAVWSSEKSSCATAL